MLVKQGVGMRVSRDRSDIWFDAGNRRSGDFFPQVSVRMNRQSAIAVAEAGALVASCQARRREVEVRAVQHRDPLRQEIVTGEFGIQSGRGLFELVLTSYFRGQRSFRIWDVPHCEVTDYLLPELHHAILDVGIPRFELQLVRPSLLEDALAILRAGGPFIEYVEPLAGGRVLVEAVASSGHQLVTMLNRQRADKPFRGTTWALVA